MGPDEILQRRLTAQHLVAPYAGNPAGLVAHLGAVQAQDYGAAKWALGQRLPGATDAALERVFAEGAILRTHVLRPTWHFVTPADIRWLLALTAPRVKATMSTNDRRLGLDDGLVARGTAAIARTLDGGGEPRYLTRAELGAALRREGIAAAEGQALGHLLMHAELDAVVCSGPRRGKQHTYALLEARVPAPLAASSSRLRGRDAPLAELTTRYFTSHGPATVQDCAWWAGLTVADVICGIELSGRRLARDTLAGRSYWLAPSTIAPLLADESVYLLPNYDEYTVAYRYRDLFYDPEPTWTPGFRDGVPIGNVIVQRGRVAGTWSRTVRKDTVVVVVRWFEAPDERAQVALAAAVARYGAFVGLPAVVEAVA